MTRSEIEDKINAQWSIILDRNAFLSQTDYVAAKIAEGVATREEYAEKLAEREAARESIRKAEAYIDELHDIVPDDEMVQGMSEEIG